MDNCDLLYALVFFYYFFSSLDGMKRKYLNAETRNYIYEAKGGTNVFL